MIGHRGASMLAPENTMTAFKLALEKGMQSIEFDVHMSKDNHCVVIHDENLKRTTGLKALVKDKTLAELKTLDAGVWKNIKYKDEKIPSLEELFEWSKSHSMLLNLEIKSDVNGAGTGLEEKVIELIKKYKFENRVVISSFNHYSLKLIHEKAPELELAAIFEGVLYEPWNYIKSIGATAMHCYWPVAMQSDYIDKAKENGIVVRAWTVNEENIIRELFSKGIDVISDDSDALKRIHQELF